MELVARRLPGIHVDVAPPSVEVLPRMDVAVFVGFASTGPLHVPVAIESLSQFSSVFGPDAPLAWDEARGERVYAYLGPAVRAFFANGGRRCWVIRVARTVTSEALRHRVADSQVATANRFAIPGVLAVATGAPTLRPAIADARCEGSWSDDLRIAAALSRRSFGLDMLASDASPPDRRITFRTRFGPRPGDLIELGDPNDLCVYAVVAATRVSADPGGPSVVEATVCAAFERVIQGASPASPPDPSTGEAHVEGVLASVPATLSWPTENAHASLRLDEPVPATLERGHWARWENGGGDVWLRIDDIDRAPAFVGSPPVVDVALVRATVTGPAWRQLDGEALLDAGAMRHAHVLTIDLRVTGGTNGLRLTDVGLTPQHPAGWWTHRSDAEFYQPREPTGVPPDHGDVPGSVERFALCRAAEVMPLAWIPLGASPLFGDALPPLAQTATALERDGLATFDADLFLDPELATTSMELLPELADSIRFLRSVARPQLFGIHGALSAGAGGHFNEPSLLAIPDAVHLGWQRRHEGSVPDPEPAPLRPPPHWRTHRGACPPPESSTTGAPSLEGPDLGVFLDCGTRALQAPLLEGPAAPVAPGAYHLTWTDSEPGGEYVLIEARSADFSDGEEVTAGPETEYVSRAPRNGVYYYQVFARRGQERSAGSNAIAVRVRSDAWVQNSTADADTSLEREWLAIHRAALRLAAGSGDLFAALAMPRHFRTAGALRYAQRLRAVREPPGSADVDAFGFTEARALSYGALYVPWLQSAGDRSSPVPPDGAAVGVLAARATNRGAWIAAANEPLKGIVALTPAIAPRDWQPFQDGQINLVRADPRGFLTLSADTLALDTDRRPINVRRLLTLLRRLALRRGVTYAFEPNDPTLRRAVQRAFEALLTDMFRRGAFAGATAAESFRVVTDDTINPPGEADAGRFVVELRVAPSVPLDFVSVWLAQSGGRVTVSEEL